MLKSKCKFLLLFALLVTLVSTLSFATVEPEVTTSIDTNNLTTEGGTTNIDDILAKDNWVNGDLYLADDSIEIDKVVDGNAFVVANEVTVTGEIGGDLFVCANKLTIDGAYVYSNLFAVANEIVINGTVYDVYAIANNFTLDTNGFVCRDLRVSANTLNITGQVNRNAFVSAAKYNFNYRDEALIGGNLEYSSSSEANIPEGAVTGEVKYNIEAVKEEPVAERVFSYIFDAINSLVFTLVVILLAIWLAPKFIDRVKSMSTKKACVCLGIGIATPLVAIVALMLLLFSTVCSIVALAGTFMFIAICMAGTAFASIYFGSLLAKAFKWNDKFKFVLASLIASLIIWAISQMPYIGGLFGFLVALFGIGILVVNVIYRKEEPKEETIQETAE